MQPNPLLPRGLALLPAVLLVLLPTLTAAPAATLAERLGYQATDKVLIVNGDDTGMCHAANVATIEALEKGLMRSATIMVPCPWFLEIAAYAKSHPDKDFGIHLCHTSEWSKYRWGPVAPRDQVPGLIDPEGYLWKDIFDVYAHASPTQALIEARAQVRRALSAGVDVTHLDSHMGTLQLNPDYVKTYLQLAVEFDLPVRMASQETLAKMGHPGLRDEFAARGILFTDYFIYEELPKEKDNVRNFWLGVVANLKPGITELYIHAGIAGDELKAVTGSWKTRSEEFEVFTHDEEMKRLVENNHIKLAGYRAIRELQRGGRGTPKAP